MAGMPNKAGVPQQQKNLEMVFFNFEGANESIPRNSFRQASRLAGRYGNPIPIRFLVPHRLF